MGQEQRKVNLSRAQMLKALQENGFSFTEVGRILHVDEASVRRACKRLDIDVDMERSHYVATAQTTQYATKGGNSGRKANSSTFVVIPDMHAHTVVWESLKVVCDFIKDYRPSYLIQIGDIMDYECLLGIGKKRYPAFDGKDMGGLNREFQAVAKIISMLNEAAPKGCKKIFLEGNHEHRVTELLRKAPEFADQFKLDRRVNMSGWDIKAYLEKFKLGKLNFIHGEFYGQTPTRKHLQVYQKNVVFGHTHAIEQASLPSPMREIPIVGYNIGCLCTLNADYCRNKSSRVEHGFGYGYFDEQSGDFDCTVKRIIHGKFWAEGKRYGV